MPLHMVAYAVAYRSSPFILMVLHMVALGAEMIQPPVGRLNKFAWKTTSAAQRCDL